MLRKSWGLEVNNNSYDADELFCNVISKVPYLYCVSFKLKETDHKLKLTEIYLLFQTSVSESFVMSILPNSKIIYDITEKRILSDGYNLITYLIGGIIYEHSN